MHLGTFGTMQGFSTMFTMPQDKQLVPMLQMYKKSGRKVFLATNSLWDYTNVVMNFLVRCCSYWMALWSSTVSVLHVAIIESLSGRQAWHQVVT